jgi:DNA-binding PadR family transcriptional regulator
VSDLSEAPMRSPVNWALLGLVIERPSYAYELARRFERTYRDVLSLSSKSHVYTALGALQTRALIEEVPSTRTGRQPRPRYRATPRGVRGYAEWIVSQVDEDRRRQLMVVLQVSVLGTKPKLVLEILDRYEQAWRMTGAEANRASDDVADEAGCRTFVARVLAEENVLTVGAKLSWLQDVRRDVEGLERCCEED